MDKKLLELYGDNIISSFGQITATGLSRALEGSISHDKNNLLSLSRRLRVETIVATGKTDGEKVGTRRWGVDCR